MWLGILWAVVGVAIWWIYHSLFTTVYFSLSDGCLTELIVIGVISAVVTVLIVGYWYITVPVLVIALIIAILKKVKQ